MDFDSPDSTVVCILDAKCLKPFIIFPFLSTGQTSREICHERFSEIIEDP